MENTDKNNAINVLQISALSRVNFCFYELKKNPPLQWTNNVIDINSLEKTKENFQNLGIVNQMLFKKELFQYLIKESTTEARMMLIINYLSALLIKSDNNKISIHKNHKEAEINTFMIENSDLINRLKTARDKVYSHIDLDFMDYIKAITFDEIHKCINFLNKLLNYKIDFNV